METNQWVLDPGDSDFYIKWWFVLVRRVALSGQEGLGLWTVRRISAMINNFWMINPEDFPIAPSCIRTLPGFRDIDSIYNPNNMAAKRLGLSLQMSFGFEKTPIDRAEISPGPLRPKCRAYLSGATGIPDIDLDTLAPSVEPCNNTIIKIGLWLVSQESTPAENKRPEKLPQPKPFSDGPQLQIIWKQI